MKLNNTISIDFQLYFLIKFSNILDLMPTTVVPNASGQESHIRLALDTDDDALQQQSILSKTHFLSINIEYKILEFSNQ